jgi:hypothetical protein
LARVWESANRWLKVRIDVNIVKIAPKRLVLRMDGRKKTRCHLLMIDHDLGLDKILDFGQRQY